MRFGNSLLWTGLFASIAVSGCGNGQVLSGDGGEIPYCVPGEQNDCHCPGGLVGVQICLDDGTFAACHCDGAIGGSGTGGSGTGAVGTGGNGTGGNGTGGNGTGGNGTGGSMPVGTETELSAGSSILIDVFVMDAGILLVFQDAVMLVDRAGNQMKTLSWPRDITSAAFDGARVVIADQAILTTLDLDLQEVASANVVEVCASAVLVGGGRFVCGPENDWDRVFYTHDATTGELIGTSVPYTYNGIPMRRVPGTDDFIAVTVDSSPSDFHLYSVGADDVAVYVNESPYHGDFPITDIYAFDGSPPEHLITHTGLMLKIYGPKCNPSESSFSTDCFLKDGALGTLSGNERFIGMDSDAAGKVYGITSSANAAPWDSACAPSCGVQRADVATHVVESKTSYALDLGAVVAARHDPISNTLVVGYRLSGDYYFPGDPYPGHRVALLPYQ
ncbi:MAG: hypothetical protein U0441_25700 [Polyangiaceae bacterium]